MPSKRFACRLQWIVPKTSSSLNGLSLFQMECNAMASRTCMWSGLKYARGWNMPPPTGWNMPHSAIMEWAWCMRQWAGIFHSAISNGMGWNIHRWVEICPNTGAHGFIVSCLFHQDDICQNGMKYFTRQRALEWAAGLNMPQQFGSWVSCFLSFSSGWNMPQWAGILH